MNGALGLMYREFGLENHPIHGIFFRNTIETCVMRVEMVALNSRKTVSVNIGYELANAMCNHSP